jgi:transcriptional regulator GlxA family with amidase domain
MLPEPRRIITAFLVSLKCRICHVSGHLEEIMHRIGIVVFPDFQLISLAAVPVFELANAFRSAPIYDVRLISEIGGEVRSSGGVSVQTEGLEQPRFDTILVAGGASRLPIGPAMIDFIKSAASTSRRVTATCTGAFVLAAAGLLDGKRATTHWQYAVALRKDYPRVRVEEDRIFIKDGAVWTSAGMTAVIDLALAMVEEDLGRDISKAVARQLVVYHRRAGGQSQHSTLLELEPKSDRVQSALAFAKRHLRENLSVEQLADIARLSPRQFSRVFRMETGKSPAKAVEQLRIEAARLMFEDGRHSVEDVVRETGFENRERLRRAFLRTLGEPPQTVRRAARLQRTA